jgi:hypothetical protein
MKKLLVIFLIVGVNQLCAQPWKTVKGNNNIKKEGRTVGSFSSLQSKGPLDVKLFPAWSILFGDRLKLNLRTLKNKLTGKEDVMAT